jgi:hypothetical protein
LGQQQQQNDVRSFNGGVSLQQQELRQQQLLQQQQMQQQPQQQQQLQQQPPEQQQHGSLTKSHATARVLDMSDTNSRLGASSISTPHDSGTNNGNLTTGSDARFTHVGSDSVVDWSRDALTKSPHAGALSANGTNSVYAHAHDSSDLVAGGSYYSNVPSLSPSFSAGGVSQSDVDGRRHREQRRSDARSQLVKFCAERHKDYVSAHMIEAMSNEERDKLTQALLTLLHWVKSVEAIGPPPEEHVYVSKIAQVERMEKEAMRTTFLNRVKLAQECQKRGKTAGNASMVTDSSSMLYSTVSGVSAGGESWANTTVPLMSDHEQVSCALLMYFLVHPQRHIPTTIHNIAAVVQPVVPGSES